MRIWLLYSVHCTKQQRVSAKALTNVHDRVSTDRNKRRSSGRSRTTSRADRRARKSRRRDTRGRTRRNRYTRLDRYRSVLRWQTWDRLFWGGCNPPGKRPHTPRLLCRYRVLLLRKPYWGQLNFLGKGTTFIPQPAEPVQFSGGDGQIRTADLSLRRRPNIFAFRRAQRTLPVRDLLAVHRNPAPQFSGGDGQIRTADLSLRRRPLYPTELRPRTSRSNCSDCSRTPARQSLFGDVPPIMHPIEMNLLHRGIRVRGRGREIRTGRGHA